MSLSLGDVFVQVYPGVPESSTLWQQLSQLLRTLAAEAEARAAVLTDQPSTVQLQSTQLSSDSTRVTNGERLLEGGNQPAAVASPEHHQKASCQIDLQGSTQGEDGTGHQNEVPPPAKKKQKKEKKAFDITSYHVRYIALEIMYIGWDYMGFSYQPTEPKTIEGALFEALRRTKLVAENGTWESMQYSRCGRTDRGVSALGQIVALKVRSNAKATGPPLPAGQECDYPAVLNRALPPEIRILGWSDVPTDFSARFSTSFREYEYFIPDGSGLDLAAMQQAAGHFVGQHDFRNFCKVDAEHVNHFVRHILDFRIEELQACAFGVKRVLRVHIRGTAFLWHQVRCMVAVLCLVGQGFEAPQVVKQLLNVDSCGCKPQYNMADEEPLLFYSCAFKDLTFRRTPQIVAANQAVVDTALNKQLAGAALLHTCAERLKQHGEEIHRQNGEAVPVKKAIRHIRLLMREREAPLEAKFAKFGRTLTQPKPGLSTGEHA